MRKLKFYLIGFIPGLLLVFFILNQKGAGCSGYLPNSRVIAETLSKNIIYSNEAKSTMQHLNLNENFVKDSLITTGNIDFEKSNPQQRPCPDYCLIAHNKGIKYQISFVKCKDEVTIKDLKKL